MTRRCECGGMFRRTDIKGEYNAIYGRVMYKDIDPLHANWRCDKCGKTRTQRKRQPRPQGVKR